MADLTPLERLDNAIHDFLAETEGGGKVITGWVVGYSTSHLEPGDADTLSRITGANYTFGPQTSVTDAAGITRFLTVVFDGGLAEIIVGE